MSVHLCICPSVGLSPRKSAVTFEPGDGSARNFQGRPHSSQVIFGRDQQGQARTPKNGVSAKSISSQGFEARGSYHTFSESRQQGEKNVGSGILNFGPQPEKMGPILELGLFFIKGTPADLGHGSIQVLCVRVIGHTQGAPGVRLEGRGVKI